MTVPYHTHNFEIPIAERADILAGTARDKVAVPASLGSAAAADKSEFATAEQGAKIEAAADAARKAGEAASKAGEAVSKADEKLTAAQQSAAQAGRDAASAAAAVKAKLNNDFSRGDGTPFNIADGKILGFVGGKAVPIDPPASAGGSGGRPSADAGNMLKQGKDGGAYLASADVQNAVAAYISANKDSLKKELGGSADVTLTVGWQ